MLTVDLVTLNDNPTIYNKIPIEDLNAVTILGTTELVDIGEIVTITISENESTGPIVLETTAIVQSDGSYSTVVDLTEVVIRTSIVSVVASVVDIAGYTLVESDSEYFSYIFVVNGMLSMTGQVITHVDNVTPELECLGYTSGVVGNVSVHNYEGKSLIVVNPTPTKTFEHLGTIYPQVASLGTHVMGGEITYDGVEHILNIKATLRYTAIRFDETNYLGTEPIEYEVEAPYTYYEKASNVDYRKYASVPIVIDIGSKKIIKKYEIEVFRGYLGYQFYCYLFESYNLKEGRLDAWTEPAGVLEDVQIRLWLGEVGELFDTVRFSKVLVEETLGVQTIKPNTPVYIIYESVK